MRTQIATLVLGLTVVGASYWLPSPGPGPRDSLAPDPRCQDVENRLQYRQRAVLAYQEGRITRKELADWFWESVIDQDEDTETAVEAFLAQTPRGTLSLSSK